MAKFKLKLPSGKGKKKKVLLVSGVTVAAVVSIIAILYFTNKGFKRKIDELLKGGGEGGPLVDKADVVDFRLDPDRVPPNTEFRIIGQFKDKEGDPVRVKQALFYVIENATGANGPRELLLQGTIGNNVGKFTHTISTNGFPRGEDYDVIVVDHPLSVMEIEGAGEGQSPVMPEEGKARSTISQGLGVGGVI